LSESEPVFLVDRDLGSKVVPDALRKAGCTVEVHSDHFDGETPDHEWIRTAGERGWFVITHDDKIRYNPLTRKAVLKRRVGVFIVAVKARANGSLLAKATSDAVPRMRDLIRRQPRPFFAKVYRDSSVALVANTPKRMGTIP
jgi:hypothetical protein